ncbi:MAG TPA: DEAD/DEAH box helicase [Patescibacteria group bacterium]|nr:DEAD/DEAH box helicase [Patescibacteria group bacterium]
MNPVPGGVVRPVRRRPAARPPESGGPESGAPAGQADLPRSGAASGETAPPIAEFIARILQSERLGADVVHAAALEPQPASYAALADPLPDALASALKDLGIARPYSHQAEAIDRVRRGEDVLVVTPTASGKSLVYLVPILEAALRRPGSRSLCLFPYKALAQDQLQGMVELAAAVARRGGVVPDPGGLPGHGRPVSAAIYDGDTPDTRRREIKADPPDVLITNPDMLHLGLLAHHDAWRTFFENLDLVVVDELHVYRGIFGSHLHHILKRLLRVAALYGRAPRFVASSATVARPDRLGEGLLGRKVSVVAQSGAPRAARHLLFLNPRVSPYTAAATLMAWSLDAGYRTIAFTKARKITELLHSWLLQSAPRWRGQVSAYRSGYLPEERRDIERRLFRGELRGVISTSALELGVDIGGLDVCLLVGYPGSIVSSWQRIGRVGREDRPSLTILIALPDALDQYYMTHPDQFLSRGFEEVVFDPENKVVARAHLACAGAETPLCEADRDRYGPANFALIRELEEAGVLAQDAEGGRWFSLRRRPQRDINLRSTGSTYAIHDEDRRRVIGSIDGVRAFHETHTGAIYLHHGQQYLVRDLDIDGRQVRVVPADVDYYTQARGEKETAILGVLEERGAGPLQATLGRLKVTERITGYEKRRLHGRDRLGVYELTLPPLMFETVGLWLTIPESIQEEVRLRGGHFMGALHAAEHAMIALFPLLAICDRGDIGGISYTLHPQIGRPAIFIYDGHPGGVGLAAKGFGELESLIGRTADLLRACPCEGGCPSCVQSPKCGNGNQPLDKESAALVLEMLVGRVAVAADAPSLAPSLAPRVALPPSAAAGPGRPVVLAMGRGGEDEPAPTPRRRGADGPPARVATLFFDLETQKSAEEVGGWQNLAAMKLALAVTYNDVSGQFRTYHEKDVNELFLDLLTADRVVGYNIDRFDLPVLGGYTDRDLSRVRTLDMLADIYRKLGFRLRLADVAQATLGVGKSADGLQSLQWWKEGKIDLIEQYCRRDVEVTRDVFLFGCNNGYILYRDRDDRSLRLPVDWK